FLQQLRVVVEEPPAVQEHPVEGCNAVRAGEPRDVVDRLLSELSVPALEGDADQVRADHAEVDGQVHPAALAPGFGECVSCTDEIAASLADKTAGEHRPL